MTSQFFEEQIERLKSRFTPRPFDAEFVRLVSSCVATMENEDFRQMVDTFIGTRAANKPPLLVDFREGRIQVEKNKFKRTVIGATRAMSGFANSTVKEALTRHGFSGCKSINEAVEVQKEKQRIAKALEEKE